MTRKSEESGSWMTRRDVLAQAAMGAAAAAVAPYLGRRAGRGCPEQRSRREAVTASISAGSFCRGMPPARRCRVLRTPAGAMWTCRTTGASRARSIRTRRAAGSGAYLPTGIGWYRKKFRVPAEDRDRVVVLEFDGVYQNSEVWINGQYLGLRPYGFVPFAYELTPYLKFGAENVVAVKVDNSRQTNCRWYSGSGIYRHTWLLKTNALRVAHWGTFVTRRECRRTSATVEVKTRVANDRKADAQCTLTTELLDKDGKGVGTRGGVADRERAGRVRVCAADGGGQAEPLVAGESISLHRAQHRAARRVKLVDVYDTPIGIREAIFDAKRGFLLNGEHVKLNGVCLHQEAGCVGSAVPERDVGAAPGAAARDGMQRHPHQPQSLRRRSFWTCATAWAFW